MIGAEVKSEGKARAVLEKIQARLAARAPLALKAAAERLHLESLDLVPMDTSALLESSRVTLSGVGFAAVARVGYGIPGEVYTRWSEKAQDTVVREPYTYARIVHDLQSVAHDVGQWNYLLQPALSTHAELCEAFNTVMFQNG